MLRNGGSGHDFWLVDLSNERRCALELESRCASQYLTSAWVLWKHPLYSLLVGKSVTAFIARSFMGCTHSFTAPFRDSLGLQEQGRGGRFGLFRSR